MKLLDINEGWITYHKLTSVEWIIFEKQFDLGYCNVY